MPLLLAALVAACATRPVQPDPAVHASGDFRIVAINGQPTGGGERFTFDVHPPNGHAQFGCNATGGNLAVGNGFITTGQWIITTASCNPRGFEHFERDGFAITALPMAVERNAQGGIRLSNRNGSLDLVLAPNVAALIIGNWTAVTINGRPAAPDERIGLTVTPTSVNTTGVCNDVSGRYVIVERRLTPDGLPWPRSERGCAPERMALEDRIYAVFWKQPMVSLPTPDRLRLTSASGSIAFERKR